MASFQAHGKLLLTGEYLVLEGARALAVPLTLGQSLEVEETDSGLMEWSAYHTNGLWFSTDMSLSELFPIRYSVGREAEAFRLASILRAAQSLHPGFFDSFRGLHVRTLLDFVPEWGLGSSSTLISLLSQWIGLNPFQLLNLTFKGSGYDIACAMANSPIIYRLGDTPEWVPTSLSSAYNDVLMVYSGRKQDSRRAMADFRERNATKVSLDEIDGMASAFAMAEDTNSLLRLMRRHEEILSEVLGRKSIQEESFPDFDGQTKSLGAWGGDFFLALSSKGVEYTQSYFSSKRLEVTFRARELFL